jgi:hypothetical protein
LHHDGPVHKQSAKYIPTSRETLSSCASRSSCCIGVKPTRLSTGCGWGHLMITRIDRTSIQDLMSASEKRRNHAFAEACPCADYRACGCALHVFYHAAPGPWVLPRHSCSLDMRNLADIFLFVTPWLPHLLLHAEESLRFAWSVCQSLSALY